MTQYIVTADWTASYDDPIWVSAGETIFLNGREDIWDGHRWLWAVSRSGKEGWIPDGIVSTKGGAATVTVDYSAQELSCRAGQILSAENRTHGWTHCVGEDGKRGWVPDRNLRALARSKS